MKTVHGREIPGPAGTLKENNGTPLTEIEKKKRDEKEKENSFQSVSWLALIRSLNIKENVTDIIDILDKSVTREGNGQSYREGNRENSNFNIAKLSEVLQGKYDLRVPKLTVMVDRVCHSPTGSWMVQLKDRTGKPC
jgi:hypothetical protein